MKVVISVIFVIFWSNVIFAKNNYSGRFDFCTEYMVKNESRFQLGQIWFADGDEPKEAKQLVNYTVDYEDKPFAHEFTFTNLPKKKLWISCVYIRCGDESCSAENVSSDPEIIAHEVKKKPTSCRSKVRFDNATRIEYFGCSYATDKKPGSNGKKN